MSRNEARHGVWAGVAGSVRDKPLAIPSLLRVLLRGCNPGRVTAHTWQGRSVGLVGAQAALGVEEAMWVPACAQGLGACVGLLGACPLPERVGHSTANRKAGGWGVEKISRK